MFSSVRWKFVIIYFLLIFIAMVIAGIFIVDRLESEQIENIVKTMDQNVELILSSSSYFAEEDWKDYQQEIQTGLDKWGVAADESLFVVCEEDGLFSIIAASTKGGEAGINPDIYANRFINPMLLNRAYESGKASEKHFDKNDDRNYEHLAVPIYTDRGKFKGIIYMVKDLRAVHITVNESKEIILKATLIALGITILIGFLIASSITGPIREVTRKAAQMAEGDFRQRVEVKSDDEIGHLSSMFNTLTERLGRTMQEMNLEKSKLNTIFNYMAEGVVAIDRNGAIIHTNFIAADILGNPAYENSERLPIQILNMEELDFSEYTSLEGEKTLVVGQSIYRVKYAPFMEETGGIGGLIIVFQDITREHKLDSIRKEFVANVSHELKTPITTIKSYTETLMEGVPEEMSGRFLAVIDEECDRMTRLVRDLLQLSNIDYEKSKRQRESCSVPTMIHAVLEKLKFSIEEKGHRLELDLEEMPRISLDKDAMERVLMNIISNAVKYTEKGGTLKVSAKNKEARGIEVIVSDDGMGIPESDQGRIFERFYRVEKGRSREMGGTGLGLAIAKEIVESHEGVISLQSKEGQGTTVRIFLPFETRDGEGQETE